MRAAAPGSLARKSDAQTEPVAAAQEAPRGWPPGAPRPLRLVDPPQPVDALALAVDDAGDHAPARFRWRRRVHDVVRAEGPERILPEWWRTPPDAAPWQAGARDYFRVEAGDGRRYWLFRAQGRWYLHGLFA